MYSATALIDNSDLEKRIAANNKANEIFSIVAGKQWNTLPPAKHINLNHRSVDLTIIIDLSSESTPQADHEVILATVPDKVDIYHLDGAADTATFSPDWDSDKREKLPEQYVDHTIEDFFVSNHVTEFRTLYGGHNLVFYSVVDGFKIRWEVKLNRKAYCHAVSDKHGVTFSNGDATYI